MAALPERNRRLAAIGKSDLVLLRNGIGPNQRVDIGLDVEHIFRLHAAIGRVGHDRIEIVAVPVDPCITALRNWALVQPPMPLA